MVELANAAVVAILTRAPSSGGKSRLFAALGRSPDPALLSALLLDTIDGVRAPGVTPILAVEPPEACDEVRALVPDVEVTAQARGTLGDRMRAVMHDVLARGARAVLLVGSDLPDLQPRLIANALDALEADRDALVIGPSHDGGYCLIGASAVPAVFDDVEWGTRRVLAQTLAAAERQSVRVWLLDAMGDVDTVDDLRQVQARRTRAWWRAHTTGNP